MDDILVEFTDLLKTRLRKGVLTTEDSIRYTFFAALLNATGLRSEDVIVEFPHPTIPGARVDTWLPNFRGTDVALEFKYDRDIPSGKNAPRTQRAGAIFKDLYRLLLVVEDTGAKGVFVYVATEEMASYLRNPGNGLHDFFELARDATFRIDERLFLDRATTFRKTAGRVFSATLTGLLSTSLVRNHEVRAYEVGCG